MICVNLYGGPGSGKSTTAAGVFHYLKINGVNAELVTEYAKDKVWDKSLHILDNQLYIAAKQYHRQWRLIDQVDVIITDSPLLLGLYYNYAYNPSSITARPEIAPHFNKLILGLYNIFDNLNYFVERAKAYNQKGRVQTEEQAKQIDKEIYSLLDKSNVDYTLVYGNEKGHEFIAEEVLSLLRAKK
jgi:hypothetical protein